MERCLYIKKYRNIGLDDKDENDTTSERLVLNYSLKPEQMGDLVILIGANNSGKSNILSAIQAFGAAKVSENDTTTLFFDDKYRQPELSLCCKDEKHTYTATTKGDNEYTYYTDEKFEPKFKETQLSELDLVAACNSLINHSTYYVSDFSQAIRKALNSYEETKDFKQLKKDYLKSVFDLVENNVRRGTSYEDTTIFKSLRKDMKNDILAKELEEIYETVSNTQDIPHYFEGKFGFTLVPKIMTYTDEKISTSNLTCRIDYINNNKFFLNLFERIGVKVEEVNNAYQKYRSTNNHGLLRQLSLSINKKLHTLENDFNTLYLEKNNKYTFNISFESESFYFEIYKGSNSLNLDYQSTGFRWFFDIYFNLLTSTSLKRGDILIMDEPATNLHVKGIIELRTFLKDFAKKHGITIILATHIPFLINLDYLDELRVAKNINNICYIDNDFSSIDLNDPDSLKPIKEAFMVNNHVLLDPDKKVVFVEGITDYNYLVGFKHLLGYEGDKDITFLPIGGIGKSTSETFKADQKRISKELIRIKKHDPILLVDSDGAGKSMVNTNKDSELTVVKLNDVDVNFKQIESLFENGDLVKNNCKVKHSSTSSILKNYSTLKDFSTETIDNFKKLFEYLLDA